MNNKTIWLIIPILLIITSVIPLGRSITVMAEPSQFIVIHPEPIPFYQIIAEQVAANHTWVYHKFMCKDFSRALVKELKKEKINAFVYCGYHYELGNRTCSELNKKRFNCKHCWVIVVDHELGYFQIEPQTGKIISWEDKTYR